MIAVLPSSESEAEEPCADWPTAPVPASLEPCWIHTPPDRVYTNAAPGAGDCSNTGKPFTSSPKGPALGAPTIAVFPSLERDTE